MRHGEKDVQEFVDRHLRLFNTPPASDVVAARSRARERLRSAPVAAEELPKQAVAIRHAWRWALAFAGLAAAVATVTVMIALRGTAPATVDTGAGGLYRVSNGARLGTGDAIAIGESVRANNVFGAAIKLEDGSTVEMRSQSELFLERLQDGLRVHLNAGTVIVNAAKQPTARHLYVQTKDLTVAVVGTVFLVNAAEEGSQVSVIEGEVRVQQGATETKLRPGEHVSTSPKLELRAVKEEIEWSPRKEEHLALLQQTAPQIQAPRPQFEEAAIRPCTREQQQMPRDLPAGARGGGDVRTITITPGRFVARCITVAWLVRVAHGRLEGQRSPGDLQFNNVYSFGVDGNRGGSQDLRGAPDWAFVDGYSIEAITDGSMDVATIQHVLLRELLERRFQVKTHVEVEQISSFALTIAPSGLKLKPTVEGDCQTEKEEWGKALKPRCGMMRGDFNGANWRWELGGHRLSSIGAGISHALGVPVVDRTGNTNKFAVIWEYGPDESTPGVRKECARESDTPAGCSGRSTAPPLLTVVRQMGLQIEATKTPREFIVVDRVERPTSNF